MLINRVSNLKISFLGVSKEFEKKLFSFIDDWFSLQDTVKVQTSGSTGAPKIFDVEKQKMINSAVMTTDFLRLKKNDTALLCLPIEYISGKMMFVRALIKEMKLMATEPSTKPLERLEETLLVPKPPFIPVHFWKGNDAPTSRAFTPQNTPHKKPHHRRCSRLRKP